VPKSWIANNNLAFAMLEHGQAQEAQRFINAALKAAPSQPSVLHTAGLVNLETENFEAAVQHLAMAVKALPKHLGYQYDYARALAKAGKKDEARVVLDGILAANAPESLAQKSRKLKAGL